MAFVMHDEGLEDVLDMIFAGGSQALVLYIGLCDEVLEQADGLANITTELAVQSGYAREDVDPGTEVTIVKQGGGQYRATFAQKTFEAIGGSWVEASRWFLCTAASGTAGRLIASGDISPTVTLHNSDKLNLTTYVEASNSS